MEKLIGISPVLSWYLMTSNTTLLLQTNMTFIWLLQSEIVNITILEKQCRVMPLQAEVKIANSRIVRKRKLVEKREMYEKPEDNLTVKLTVLAIVLD